MFLFTLGLSLRMVYEYLREMRAKQDVKASDSWASFLKVAPLSFLYLFSFYSSSIKAKITDSQ